MRAGERGRLVAPAAAGYPKGLSIVGTRRAGLRAPWVPLGETLRYDVELLRCRDVKGMEGARACCSEASFPCPGPDVEDVS